MYWVQTITFSLAVCVCCGPGRLETDRRLFGDDSAVPQTPLTTKTARVVINNKKNSMASSHRLGLLVLKRRSALGCTWLVMIPLLVFVLCQLYHLQQVPRQPRSPSLPSSLELLLSHVHVQGTNLSSAPTSSGIEDANSASRLFDLESQVTERYLHIQLLLAVSSGSLSTAQRRPPLADVGTLQNLRTFQPLLTPREKARLLYLFDLFSDACRSHSLPFFLMENSLVGSLRHHGVIPWSDVSVTVAMSGEQRWLAREVLEKVEGVTLMWPNPYRWSLRLTDTRPDPPSFSRTTFLLIQFFQQNSTHVWADTWGSKRLFTADVGGVFPLTRRPFEGRLAPVPCNATSVLLPQALQQCRVFAEDLEELNFRDAGPLPCDLLSRVFPFVTRRVAMTSQSTLEQVTVNGTLLSGVEVDSACRSQGHSHVKALN